MKTILPFTLSLLFSLSVLDVRAQERVYDTPQLGLKVNNKKNVSPAVRKVIAKIKAECRDGEEVVLRFPAGRYNSYENGSDMHEYYTSNHGQDSLKKVGIASEDMKSLTIGRRGSEFVFYGGMVPVSLFRSENCVLKNLSIDFEQLHIAQVQVIEDGPERGIIFGLASWVDYRISKDSILGGLGEGQIMRCSQGIVFDGKIKHVVYNTSNIGCPAKGAFEVALRRIYSPKWKDVCLMPGTVAAMCGWERSTPGTFMSHDINASLFSVKVYYVENMGLLAQLYEGVTLGGFRVRLRGDNDSRYFITQANTTHFFECKGKTISKNGLYEGVMDDTTNVHKTCLKVIKRVDDYMLVGRYMHDQSWGFGWGRPGDDVQFVRSEAMELIGNRNQIATTRSYNKNEVSGTREFSITFKDPINPTINKKSGFGTESLTWTPEALLAGSMIRNNRARGILFSTPKKTVVEGDLFDRTPGTATLLCGDCNGQFGAGACRDVTTRHNRFTNVLINMFQFTNAVIPICPEVPNLKDQREYFHGGKDGGIVIENNEFSIFDAPILYAKLVDELIFRNNVIGTNTEFRFFHWNKNCFLLERITNVKISE